MTRLGQRTLVHCNMYRHLPVRQLEDVHYRSSQARHARLDSRAGEIRTEEEVKFWLGDQQGDLPVYRTEEKQDDVLVTLATGLLLFILLHILPRRGGRGGRGNSQHTFRIPLCMLMRKVPGSLRGFIFTHGFRRKF